MSMLWMTEEDSKVSSEIWNKFLLISSHCHYPSYFHIHLLYPTSQTLLGTEIGNLIPPAAIDSATYEAIRGRCTSQTEINLLENCYGKKMIPSSSSSSSSSHSSSASCLLLRTTTENGTATAAKRGENVERYFLNRDHRYCGLIFLLLFLSCPDLLLSEANSSSSSFSRFLYCSLLLPRFPSQATGQGTMAANV